VRVQQLADACPNADTLACRVVEVSVEVQVRTLTEFMNFIFQAYLRVQLGINALDDSRHNEAADHFIAAINSGAFSSGEAIHSKYEVFVMVRRYLATNNAFHRLCASCSSSGGTWIRCGKRQIRNGAMHSFGRVDWQKLTKHTAT